MVIICVLQIDRIRYVLSSYLRERLKKVVTSCILLSFYALFLLQNINL